MRGLYKLYGNSFLDRTHMILFSNETKLTWIFEDSFSRCISNDHQYDQTFYIHLPQDKTEAAPLPTAKETSRWTSHPSTQPPLLIIVRGCPILRGAESPLNWPAFSLSLSLLAKLPHQSEIRSENEGLNLPGEFRGCLSRRVYIMLYS